MQQYQIADSVNNNSLLGSFVTSCISEMVMDQQIDEIQQQQLLSSIVPLLQQQVLLTFPSQLLQLSAEQFRALQIPLVLELKMKQKLTQSSNVFESTMVELQQSMVVKLPNKLSFGISWLGYIRSQNMTYQFLAEEINYQMKNYCRIALSVNVLLLMMWLIQVLVWIVLYIISGLLLGTSGNIYDSPYYGVQAVAGVALISAATIITIVSFIYPLLLISSFILGRIVLLRKLKQVSIIIIEKHTQSYDHIYNLKYYESILCSPIMCFPLIAKKLVVETI